MGFGMMDGSGYMSGSGWGGMAFGGIIMLFWFALIIAVIVFLFRWMSGTSQRNTKRDALDILEQRYAHGEIDAAEPAEHPQQLKVGK